MNINPKAVGENKGRDGMEPTHPFRGRGGVPSRTILPVRGNDVEVVKGLCRTLDVRQRKEVRDYIAYLDKEQGQANLLSARAGQALERDEEMWADSLEQTLGEALGSPPSARKRSPAILGSLRASYAVVGAFVQALGIVQPVSYNRKVLYNLLAGFVVEYAKQLAAKIGAPLTFKFVLQNVEKLPALFDRAYPGYAQAGLACIVVEHLINPKPKE